MNNIPQITIDGRSISRNNSPYIIAEMSANHNGSIENAEIKIIIKPIIMTIPKSIIGLMSEITNDKNATTVVKKV